MSDDRKVRADAVLKMLPDGRQQEIFEWLNAPGNTLVRCVQWLAQDGVKTNRDSLSDWYSWYALRLKFKETERDTLNFQELVQEEMPELPQEKVTQLGSAYFNMQAIKQGNPELFLMIQGAQHKAKMDVLKYQQRERELVIAERRVRLLEAKQEKAKKVLSDEELTPEQRDAKLKKIFGMG
jgi:hypothetical protein